MSVKDFEFKADQKPYASYIKTTLGKVYVKVLNPFTGQPDDLILEGKNTESCIVDVWDVKGDMYFKKANAYHFEKGFLMPHVRKETIPSDEEIYNTLPEEELTRLLKEKFFVLQSAVNKMTSVAPIFRLLEIAKALEKSDKIIKFLEGKLAELQMKEYSSE